MSGLANSTDRSLERFSLWFCLARLVIGAQDCHSWGVEIWSDVPLQEIEEGDEERPSYPGDELWL